MWSKHESSQRGSRWSQQGKAAAYAASVVAFAYALMSLYWALGGDGLISTVGGYVQRFAHRGGAAAASLAWAATAMKAAGGFLALALVRPWERFVPRKWLLIGSTGASVVLIVYGGLYVTVGVLVLTDLIHPSRRADLGVLRWHVELWDLWFLVWGILLALATVGYWKRTVGRSPSSGM